VLRLHRVHKRSGHDGHLKLLLPPKAEWMCLQADIAVPLFNGLVDVCARDEKAATKKRVKRYVLPKLVRRPSLGTEAERDLETLHSKLINALATPESTR